MDLFAHPQTRLSLFQMIEALWSRDTGRWPAPSQWQPSVEQCVEWLQSKKLTREVTSYRVDPSPDSADLLTRGARIQLGVPCQRTERRTKDQLDQIRKNRRGQGAAIPSKESMDAMWREYKDPRSAVKELDIQKLPADALAFYRPFHFDPVEEWGIYLMVERFLCHCAVLDRAFRRKLCSFTPETLAACVLFEVFHHEFFHHLTECAATTIEVLSAGFGAPRSIYVSYWDHQYEEIPEIGKHPDHPLEEALANAYAYNSFSFLSRTELGLKTVWVKLYQEVLKKCWPGEPPGYRRAEQYIKGAYVSGGAQLLAMLLASPSLDPASIALLAKTVLPNGNSAFLQKPDIPMYLVGSESALADFHSMLPAPNETYTTLLWLDDTSIADEYLRTRRVQEKQAKLARRGARRGA